MEILQLVVDALRTQSAATMLTVAGVYVASPLAANLWIVAAKRARRRAGKAKLGPWTVRMIASGCTGLLAFGIGWRLGGWTPGKAAEHAVTIALMYPLAMWAYLSWLERHAPDAAQDFGELDATEVGVHPDPGKDA